MFGVSIYWIVVSLLQGRGDAQGTRADYERLYGLRRQFAGKVFRQDVKLNWIYQDRAAWYQVVTGPGEFEFVLVDLEQGKREPAFDHQRVAESLGELLKKSIDPKRLTIPKLYFDRKLENVFFEFGGKAIRVERATGKLDPVQRKDFPRESSAASVPRFSGPSRVRIDIQLRNLRKTPIHAIWIDPDGKPRDYGQIDPGQTRRISTFAGHVWMLTDPDRKPLLRFEARTAEEIFTVDESSRISSALPERKKGTRPKKTYYAAKSGTRSPDGRFRVVSKNHNLYLLEKDGKEFQLTRNGQPDNYYSGDIYWAPDNIHFVAFRETPPEKHTIHMVESSPRDRVQPRLHSMTYLKPGDRIRQKWPCLFDAVKREQVAVSNELFPNPWQSHDFRWNESSHEFQFRYNQRGHQVMRIVGINWETGSTRTVIDEVSPTFIDYNYKFKVRYLDDSGQIVWSSERDGWNHLYLYDATTGKLLNQITQGKWLVRRIDRIDEKNRQIWFQAGGIIPAHDPYYVHHCRCDFDGKNLTVLTGGDGTHSIQFSPTRRFLLDRYLRVDLGPVHEIRRTDNGRLVVRLETADLSALQQAGWRAPERFISTARDDRTPIFGVIYRPTNFDPKKKYPIIEYIYAGPHSSFVPKSFRVLQRAQELAELGFVVVQIDGMGTSNRSKAFHDVCWKNLGDSGFPDRIKWIKAAAKKYPWMDVNRVGIFGGSAGGQSSTRAVLAFGDFYKVAVSDCGCHDNRMDKIWWNEQWMGWPIGPHYAEQSNVTNAHRLKGKLFLIVGELDRNVDPASTMQVVDALIRANKDFDLLVVPGGGHGVGSRPYGLRRTYDFFVRHLLGVEPRSK